MADFDLLKQWRDEATMRTVNASFGEAMFVCWLVA